jgi:ribosome maturation protein SDO1
VGEKERNHALGNLWKEVAGLVADKVVDPATKRPYSVSMVEKAMQEVHFNVRGDKSAKSQVSDEFSETSERSERGEGNESKGESVER